MNPRVFSTLVLVVWASAAVAWSQDAPPPGPPPAAMPTLPPPPPGEGSSGPTTPPPPPPPPYYGPSNSYSAPPGPGMAAPGQPVPYNIYPPPGAMLVSPPQPYPYAYPPPGTYGGPMLVRPPGMVFVPAPALPSYSWSATLDALFLERSSGGCVPLGYTFFNSASARPPQLPTDSLYSDDAPFPLEAGMRFELSRTFSNDVTVAATYWGLQQWSVGSTIYGDPYYRTVLAYSPYLQLPTLYGGLDDSLGYNYGSQIENIECNVRFRLGGNDPYAELDWLWGARYVYFADHFTMTGIDDLHSATEQLDYQATNNLVGVQTGLLFVHGWDRFQWEVGLKCGLMANMYRQHGSDTANDPLVSPAGFTPYDVANTGTGLSALFEVSLAARIRLTDNLGLRLGYQFYDITGLALAPRQLGGFDHGGNVGLDGLSIGLQATW